MTYQVTERSVPLFFVVFVFLAKFRILTLSNFNDKPKRKNVSWLTDLNSSTGCQIMSGKKSSYVWQKLLHEGHSFLA